MHEVIISNIPKPNSRPLGCGFNSRIYLCFEVLVIVVAERLPWNSKFQIALKAITIKKRFTDIKKEGVMKRDCRSPNIHLRISITYL